MFRKILSCIVISLLFFVMGCNHNNNLNNIIKTSDPNNNSKKIMTPTITGDDIVIIPMSDYNLTFYKSFSCGRFFCFDILSTKEISMNASVMIDIKTIYTFNIIDENNQVSFPYYVLQNYQTIDWNKMYELYLENEKAAKDGNVYQPYLDYSNLYLDDFYKIEKNIPRLYHYKGLISFNMENNNLTENEMIENIIFKANEKEYKISTGKITLDYTTSETFPTQNITLRSLAQTDKNITPNKKGKIIIDGLSFKCNKDIKITGFNLMEKDTTIDKVSIITENNGKTMDQLYTQGMPFVCKANSQVNIKVAVNDPLFINKLSYSTILHIRMEYESDGKVYTAYYESTFRTRHNAYALYAIEYDKVDFKPYFYNFASLIGD